MSIQRSQNISDVVDPFGLSQLDLIQPIRSLDHLSQSVKDLVPQLNVIQPHELDVGFELVVEDANEVDGLGMGNSVVDLVS